MLKFNHSNEKTSLRLRSVQWGQQSLSQIERFFDFFAKEIAKHAHVKSTVDDEFQSTFDQLNWSQGFLSTKGLDAIEESSVVDSDLSAQRTNASIVKQAIIKRFCALSRTLKNDHLDSIVHRELQKKEDDAFSIQGVVIVTGYTHLNETLGLSMRKDVFSSVADYIEQAQQALLAMFDREVEKACLEEKVFSGSIHWSWLWFYNESCKAVLRYLQDSPVESRSKIRLIHAKLKTLMRCMLDPTGGDASRVLAQDYRGAGRDDDSPLARSLYGVVGALDSPRLFSCQTGQRLFHACPSELPEPERPRFQ